MIWLLPYLATSFAILGLGFLAHAYLAARRKLSFELGMTGLCWSFACVIGVILS